MGKKEKGRTFRSLPPNFADLDSEMKKAVEEQMYKQQLKEMSGFHLGAPELVSGPGKKKVWIKGQD